MIDHTAKSYVYSAAGAWPGRTLVTGHTDGNITIYDIADDQSLRHRTGVVVAECGTLHGRELAVSTDGAYIIAVDFYSGIHVLNSQGEHIGCIPVKEGLSVQFRADSHEVMVHCDSAVSFIDCDTRTVRQTLRAVKYCESNDRRSVAQLPRRGRKSIRLHVRTPHRYFVAQLPTFGIVDIAIDDNALALVLPGMIPAVWTPADGLVELNEAIGGFESTRCCIRNGNPLFYGVTETSVSMWECTREGDVVTEHVIRRRTPQKDFPVGEPLLGAPLWFVDTFGIWPPRKGDIPA